MSKSKDKAVANYMSGEILLYESANGEARFDTYIFEDNIWINQLGLASLFQTSVTNICKHIRNVYKDGELTKESTMNSQFIVQDEGGVPKQRKVLFYNLEMVLAIGFRAKSSAGTQFRRWANQVLSEYARKGFATNDERLRNPKEFGADYYDELLARIRAIRASEKRYYEKIKQIYSLAIDYNARDEQSREFFATVQNKFRSW